MADEQSKPVDRLQSPIGSYGKTNVIVGLPPEPFRVLKQTNAPLCKSELSIHDRGGLAS